jgi:hypothetical protein
MNNPVPKRMTVTKKKYLDRDSNAGLSEYKAGVLHRQDRLYLHTKFTHFENLQQMKFYKEVPRISGRKRRSF